jgi:transcriptional regulator with XRE-family HTH domain
MSSLPVAPEVIRCTPCGLNQYVNAARSCRRCKAALVSAPALRVIATLKLTPRPSQSSLVTVAGQREMRLTQGAAIRDARLKLGLSQYDLAEQMGCPRTYISKLENGRCLLTVPSVFRFAEALQCTAAELVPNLKSTASKTDHFIDELAHYLPLLTAEQRDIVLGSAEWRCERALESRELMESSANETILCAEERHAL